jgi:dihydropteroate synthase
MNNLFSVSIQKSPLIMGILNLTPDSFFDGGKYNNIEGVKKRAIELTAQGADIIDIGGESSRPGASYVSAEEELSRIIPALKEIKKNSNIIVSVDTYKAEVARIALLEGADVINDIKGLSDDKMAEVCAKAGCPVVIMHMKGLPGTMQDAPFDACDFDKVVCYLKKRADYAVSSGIKCENIILDPGIGFGKTAALNIELIKKIPDIKALGYPVLIGASRKSLIGDILGNEKEERLTASVVIHTLSVLKGASVVRVHDVKQTKEALKILEAFGEL